MRPTAEHMERENCDLDRVVYTRVSSHSVKPIVCSLALHWGFQNFDRSLSNNDQGLFVEHVGGHQASLAALITIKPIIGSARAELDC